MSGGLWFFLGFWLGPLLFFYVGLKLSLSPTRAQGLALLGGGLLMGLFGSEFIKVLFSEDLNFALKVGLIVLAIGSYLLHFLSHRQSLGHKHSHGEGESCSHSKHVVLRKGFLNFLWLHSTLDGFLWGLSGASSTQMLRMGLLIHRWVEVAGVASLFRGLRGRRKSFWIYALTYFLLPPIGVLLGSWFTQALSHEWIHENEFYFDLLEGVILAVLLSSLIIDFIEPVFKSKTGYSKKRFRFLFFLTGLCLALSFRFLFMESSHSH